MREFEEALARAYGDGLQPARDALEEALGLYRGDLLPDCYEEWIVPERDRLRHRCLKALEDLADLLELRRAYGEAIGRVRQLLQLDPLSEGAYRRLMRLLILSGDRASAVQAYHACATALRRGLDVEPDAETQESYRRLLDLEAAAPPQAPLETAPTLVGRAPEWQRLLAAHNVVDIRSGRWNSCTSCRRILQFTGHVTGQPLAGYARRCTGPELGRGRVGSSVCRP